MKRYVNYVLVLAWLAFLPSRVMAAGLLADVAELGGYDPKFSSPVRVRVETGIVAQVATTMAEVEFPVGSAGAHRFMFPLPAAASAVGLETWDGSKWVKADLKKEAPKGSPEVADFGVNQMLDQYLGDNPFVVDLPGPFHQGKASVRLTYIEILPYAFGEVSYTFPMDSGPFGPFQADSIEVHVSLATLRDIKDWLVPVYGPASVEKEGPRDLVLAVTAEDKVVSEPFKLIYREKQEGFFFSLLADHEDCHEDGFFLLVVEPMEDVGESEIIPKYFTFIVDRSGSMDGYKVEQARDAAGFCVTNLYPSDRFNVIAYNESVSPLFTAPRQADEGNKAAAASFIDYLQAGGSTDIHQAVVTALDADFDTDWARLIILLTDGQPTAGITAPKAIRQAVKAKNQSKTRIYTFGIGQDVDMEFLTALSAENFGEARFLDANADIKGVIKDFFLKINRPVLTDVGLDWGGFAVDEIYPVELTDIFAGSQIFILGRYKGGGKAQVSLAGNIKGAKQEYPFQVELPECAQDQNPFLPRLWAKKKIEHLLDELAKDGYDQDKVDEVVALATEYGIQTPYTSFGVSAPAPSDPMPPVGSGPSGGSSGSSSSGSWDWGGSGGDDDGFGGLVGDLLAHRLDVLATLVILLIAVRALRNARAARRRMA